MSEIQLKGVNKTIQGVTVLKDISVSFKSGTIYGLKGKNGCGKTMLMRMICGLIHPTTGEVWINDKQLHKNITFPPSIGVLIENPSFLPEYTGYRNLEMLASLQKGLQKKDILQAMEAVGLNAAERKCYHKYSLGMKQKLGIANAIMGEPDIIILDEPINALDEDSVIKIKQVLISLRNKGKLIILACHDKEELEYLSDVIYIMKDGCITGMEEVSHENVSSS